MSQSTERKALANDSSEATGATNPYVRARLNVAYGYGLSGAGVKIGIVDSGFNLVNGKPQHNEFSAVGKLMSLDANPATLSDQHGINVSGLAAASRDGVGMEGVAYGATLYYGDSNPSVEGLKATFDEYAAKGVLASSNSYGLNINGNASSAWKPVETQKGSFEATAKNAIAYRDSAGITTAQALANIIGGTSDSWTALIASFKAFQDKGGVIVWANSNYGLNTTTNATATDYKGIDDADLAAALPLIVPQLTGGWITVVNGTSKGLATQILGQDFVNNSKAIENNIFLMSANCGAAAAICLTHDGSASYSASNTGIASYGSQTGTSQATPEVTGMIALLREAFPAASAADIAARLLYTADNSFFINGTVSKLSTATYTNANGTITQTVSDIWGHGFPNLQNALAPVGTSRSLTLSGQRVDLAQLAGTMQVGRAFGDAGRTIAGSMFLYNDTLNGVFASTLGKTVTAAPDTSLHDMVNAQLLNRGLSTISNGKGLTLALATSWGIDNQGAQHPQTAFSFRQEVGAASAVATGFGFSADSALGFKGRHAELRAASPSDTAMGIPYLGLGNHGQHWVATSNRFGGVGVSVAAFGSSSEQPYQAVTPTASRNRALPTLNAGGTSGFVADVVFDQMRSARLNVSFGQVNENGSVLGSVATTATLRQGSQSRLARVAFAAPLVGKWGLQGNYVTAQTRLTGADTGLLGGVSDLRSDAMAVALTGDDVIAHGGHLTLGISQPLRVAAGRGTLNLPQQLFIDAPGSYHYGYTSNGLALAPSGRELDYTAEFTQRLSTRVSWGISGRMISQPGHVANARVAGQGLATLKLAL